MDEPEWPNPENAVGDSATLEFRKALFQAKLDRIKAETAAQTDATKADYAAYYAKLQVVYQAYVDTAKASIERVQNRAMYINTAAAAISALYTAFLGFRFVKDVNDKTAATLPVRGVTPLFFFAIAIVLATFYLSFLSRRTDSTEIDTSDDLGTDAQLWLNGYLQWVKAIIEPRLSYLRAAVVSLAFGVTALPLPFVPFGRLWACIPFAVAIAVIVILVVAVGGRDENAAAPMGPQVIHLPER